MIRLFIADDHFLVREGLKRVLSASCDIVIAGEATNGGETLSAIRNKEISVLLLDMSMPGISGIDLVKRIKGERPALPILILSMHGEAQLAAKALQTGASGYVTKGKGGDILASAIRKVAGGQKYIDPDLAEKIIFDIRMPTESVQEQLTDRESQVLKMLQVGKTVTQIAHELALSPKTVSTHKIRVMQKLNCHNNAELLRYSAEDAIEVCC